MAAAALDAYQDDQYGSPHAAPPPAQTFSGSTRARREKNRQEFIEETIRRWHDEIAPALLQKIRTAIIPLEVQFRRDLERQRLAEKATAEAKRREMAAMPSSPVQSTRGPDHGTNARMSPDATEHPASTISPLYTGRDR